MNDERSFVVRESNRKEFHLLKNRKRESVFLQHTHTQAHVGVFHVFYARR